MSAVWMLISWNLPNTGAGVYASCRKLPMYEPLSDATHANVLELGELEDAVLRTFAAAAAFLDAAKRRDFGRDEAGVETDDPVLQGFGDPPRPRQVARIDVRGKTELGVVGELHGLFVGVHAEQRRDRAESLLARKDHVARHVGEYGRLVESATERVALAAGDDFRALRFRISDVIFDLGERLRIDQRPLIGFALQSVTHAKFADRFGEFLCEGVVNRRRNDEAIRAHAGLACVAVLALDRAGDSGIEVGVIQHQEWCVATEFERHLLDRAGALRHQ